MPTVNTLIFTGGGLQPALRPDLARTIAVRLKPSTTFAEGALVGEITATPGIYGPYVDANVDGTGVARGILKYACITDADGNITLGTVATGLEQGQTKTETEMYFAGTFNTQDLPQAGAGSIDAAAIVDLKGILIKGTTADGWLHF